MRNPWPAEVERGRILTGHMASAHGNHAGGAFVFLRGAVFLRVVASSGEEWEAAGFDLPAWEHVSISTAARCPTWEEMAWIANLFWEPSETLIQFRPAEAGYVNCHPYCLHWWRPVGVDLPRPPAEAVGPVLKLKMHAGGP